ncbi:MAG: hypothetical protein A2049_10325 [Elusimicrobia bacterium GWA2_62_23]|nr:MAG: hypothetical protein A2049_10325 [Elusimicrobia bacterium GWA2_62_23]OGR66518.1 MAG: hypothetical protein A2179_04695 [Elusimicrobia bacterium GWC2_63_65]
MFFILALVCPAAAGAAAPELNMHRAADIKGWDLKTPVVPAPIPAFKGYELACAGGKLQVLPKDASRFNVLVNDAAMTSALRAAAAKLFQGEQYLKNTRILTSSSFMVTDLLKQGGLYDGGQFAPKLQLLGGGRARLTLTYFRMANSQSYEFREVISFDFSGCSK